jgi:hypothetical protein
MMLFLQQGGCRGLRHYATAAAAYLSTAHSVHIPHASLHTTQRTDEAQQPKRKRAGREKREPGTSDVDLLPKVMWPCFQGVLLNAFLKCPTCPVAAAL